MDICVCTFLWFCHWPLEWHWLGMLTRLMIHDKLIWKSCYSLHRIDFGIVLDLSGRDLVDLDRCEFLCPTCRRLANVILPHVEQESQEPRDFQAALKSIRNSITFFTSQANSIPELFNVLKCPTSAMKQQSVPNTWTIIVYLQTPNALWLFVRELLSVMDLLSICLPLKRLLGIICPML